MRLRHFSLFWLALTGTACGSSSSHPAAAADKAAEESKPEESKPEEQAAAPPQELTDEESLPVMEDFEEDVAAEIDADNYSAMLDRVEKEIVGE